MKPTRPLQEQSSNEVWWSSPVILAPGKWTEVGQEAGGEDRVLQAWPAACWLHSQLGVSLSHKRFCLQKMTPP